jgi:hypothetical protein
MSNRFYADNELNIAVEFDIIRRLRPAAAARDMPVTRLIRELLDVVAQDDLVAAILDDQPPRAA